MDLVVHVFRTSASQSKSPDPSLLSAKRRLAAILTKNPQKARNLAWHAAQIIAVANEVSCRNVSSLVPVLAQLFESIGREWVLTFLVSGLGALRDHASLHGLHLHSSLCEVRATAFV
jgi:hypothetical protein